MNDWREAFLRDLAHRRVAIEGEFADFEGNIHNFERAIYPNGSPDPMRDMRRGFFAGVDHAFTGITQAFEPDATATSPDAIPLEQVEVNLQHFIDDYVLREPDPAHDTGVLASLAATIDALDSLVANTPGLIATIGPTHFATMRESLYFLSDVITDTVTAALNLAATIKSDKRG